MALLSSEEYIQFKDFILRQPLWESIENLVPHYDERLEVKKVIGHSLVEETLDLHIEVSFMLKFQNISKYARVKHTTSTDYFCTYFTRRRFCKVD